MIGVGRATCDRQGDEMAKPKDMPIEVIELVAQRFRVLGEPVRLQILQLLDREEMSVGELATAVGTTQPNVSKHLRILQESGLVGRRQEGNTAWYRITDPTVFDLCDVVCGSLGDRFAQQAATMRELAPRPPSPRKR